MSPEEKIETSELDRLRSRIAELSRAVGPTPDYTGEGSAWVPPVEAKAVVVSELTDEDYFRLVQSITCPRGTESVGQLLTAFIRERARAIPDDRVLGEGMVGVDRQLLLDAEDALGRAEGLGPCGLGLLCQVQDALRANQGGAANGS